MTIATISSALRGSLTLAAIVLSFGLHGQAQSESTILDFTSPGPRYSFAGLISDSSGNLYGTTSIGGTSPTSGCGRPNGCGTVFELSPSGSGWTETILYSFNGGADGLTPAATLVFDAEGNLYGTTAGTGQLGTDTLFQGTVFQLSPTPGGGWAHKVLHEFTGGKDGYLPTGALTLDSAGNLYGTAVYGGDLSCGGPPQPAGCGLAFKLERTASGGWAEIVLHAFTGNNAEGHPEGSLAWDAAGNLYGRAFYGGIECQSYGQCGILYRLTPVLSGGWKFAPIHTFTGGEDGDIPGPIIFDASGIVYGTTGGGGASNAGTVFRLAPTSKGGWEETVIYSFAGGTDGAGPTSVVLGPEGILYGSTESGGKPNACPRLGGCGTVFAIAPDSNGWSKHILHSFSFPDGSNPNGVLFSGGNLYGTTSYGGSDAFGVVFEVTP
jgi:uncharacterized repeat protein (TIGR03803 family)